MSERLEALPEDKRQKILQASLDEFAEHGYLNASTNRIVRAAGISKGLLFHYFENKKKLFLYVLDHTINHLMQKVKKYSVGLSDDLFERMGQYALIKTQVGIEEHDKYHILYDVYITLPQELKNELMERYGQIFKDQRKQLYMAIDTSKLKEGVTAEIAVNLITDFLDGYYQRNLDYYKTLKPDELLEKFNSIRDDMMGYMDIIKRGIYKDEV